MHISKELNWLWKLHENSWVRGLFGSHNFFTASTWSQGTYRWSHIINRRDLISNLVHVAQPFLDEAHPSIAKLATSHLDNEVGRQLGGIRISFASNIAMTDCHLHVSHRISKPVSPQNPRWTWSEKRKDACILDWNLHGHGRWWFPKLQSPHCTGISFQSFSGSISLSIFWHHIDIFTSEISPPKSMDSPLCFGQKISPERCRCDSSSRFNRILVVTDVVGQTSLAGCSLLRWVFFVSCSSSSSSSSSVFSIVCLSRLVLCPTARATSSQRPFYVNVDTVFLRPDEDIEIRVEFDPAFKVDRVCGTVKQKLSIVYQDGDLVKGAPHAPWSRAENPDSCSVIERRF